jgi:hypothetical protein
MSFDDGRRAAGNAGPSSVERTSSIDLNRVAVAFAAPIVDAPPQPDPIRAYRAYLCAIARREFVAVVAGMTEACARQLFGSRDTPDFLALFELWCDSQRDPVVITRHAVDRDLATIDVRSRHTAGRVELRLVDGAWRVRSERHRPLRAAAVR